MTDLSAGIDRVDNNIKRLKQMETLKREIIENSDLRRDLIENSASVLAKYGYEIKSDDILDIPEEVYRNPGLIATVLYNEGPTHSSLVVMKGPETNPIDLSNMMTNPRQNLQRNIQRANLGSQ